MTTEYWEEVISNSLESREAWDVIEALSDSLLKCLAEDIETARENYSMAYGHDVIPNPMKSELDNAVFNLKQSREQIEELEGRSTEWRRKAAYWKREADAWEQEAKYWKHQYVAEIQSQ